MPTAWALVEPVALEGLERGLRNARDARQLGDAGAAPLALALQGDAQGLVHRG
jgi:hypothetical protein